MSLADSFIPADPAAMELVMGAGSLAGISWDELHLQYQLSAGPERDWRVLIRGLFLNEQLPALDLQMRCPGFRWGEYGPDCAAAQIALLVENMEPFELNDVRILSSPDQSLAVLWDGPPGRVALGWQPAEAALSVQLEDLDLGLLPAELLAEHRLDVLSGRVAADLRLEDGSVRGFMRWSEGSLDGFDGLAAAEDVDLELELDMLADASELSLVLRQNSGELLLGSMYLPPPAAPLELSLSLVPVYVADAGVDADVPQRLLIRHFSLSDPAALAVVGSAELILEDEAWALNALQLDQLAVQLPSFWPRWMEGPAAAAGFGGLGLSGEISGRASWRSGEVPMIDLRLAEVSIADPRERFELSGLQAQVDSAEAALIGELAWDSAGFWGLPLGPSAVGVYFDELGMRLLDPFQVPILDGAIAIDSLAWLNLAAVPSQWVLDMRIEPLSLSLLTRELGLIELGGTLAGRFPGVQYQQERLIFAGGITMEAFSGDIVVDGLEIERPFGSLPALAASVEFRRLDLLELTGAFDFGRMEGQMSGWMRGLRLLDWRPVAMDARVFTHADVPRRRISQRAVNNLSGLGGASGAILSGTVLRVFDDFNYHRAGLACRLSNNICHIDGVGQHESGGFFIVEGRGLPRLDVIGHRRLVDWPQLVRQLEAIVSDGN